MPTTPQSEIDELNSILYGENIEFLRDTLAFAVAECVVKYRDPELLDAFPPWVGELVQQMCEVYRQHGHYRVISSLGEADHSEMVDKLAGLLKPGVQ